MRAEVPITYVLPRWVRSPRIQFFLGNELRAVFPLFLAAVGLMLLLRASPEHYPRVAGLMVFALGCAAVSATVFGHDFTHRTLVMTLGQPISREALWKTRLKISFFLISVLTIIAAAQNGLPEMLWRALFQRAVFFPMALLQFGVAALSGICVAPWFTLLSRSVLAGTVFTICLPFVLLYASDLLAGWISQEPFGRHLLIPIFGIGFLTLCAVGLLETRRRMLHLEALDPVRLSVGSFAGTVRPRAVAPRVRSARPSPWLALASKEFRLQWIALVPAIGLAVTISAIRQTMPHNITQEMLAICAVLWSLTTCVIIGAAGSAEERQMGVLNTQALLPVGTRKQWWIKSALLIVLGQILAVAWPLWLLNDPAALNNQVPEPKWWIFGGMMLISMSVYISTLCRTTMKAVLVALPFAAFGLMLLLLMHANETQMLDIYLARRAEIENRFVYMLNAGNLLTNAALLAPYACAVLIAGTLLRFASRNHFAENPAEAFPKQAAVFTFLVISATIFCVALAISAVH